MISGTTTSSLIESSKEMYKRSKKQIKSKGKKEPKNLKAVYMPKSTSFNEKTSEEMYGFEPRMTNRWLIKFPKKANITQWVGKALTLPTYPFNLGGKITVVLIDPIYPSTTQALMKFVENQKPFKLKIDILDPLTESIGKWILKGCLIQTIDFSTLDYQSNEPTQIYITVSYNEVKYKSK